MADLPGPMNDPLEVLRTPDRPVDPDPDFAARLRGRLARSLAAPEGVSVNTPNLELSATGPNVAPQSFPSPVEGDGDVGYFALWVSDIERAAAFYGAVLGWSYAERSPYSRMIQGSTSRAIVALEAPGCEYWPERRPGGFCSRAVADIDAAVARVRAAGGRSTDPRDTPYGRSADCADDQGGPFSLHQRAQDTPRPPMNGAEPGDVAYLTLQVPDSVRARSFHASVFGWTFTGGHAADGWQAQGPAPMTGLSGGHGHPDVVPMYRVEDMAAAVARVRTGGGTATNPERQPYGISSDCTDDQGLRFYLGRL